MNAQRLTKEDPATDEYSGHVEQSNTLLNKQLKAKDININIDSVPDWNWLSIENIDSEFDDKFHKVISNDDVPHDAEDQPKEEPTHTPKMFESYIYMEIVLPRGLDG